MDPDPVAQPVTTYYEKVLKLFELHMYGTTGTLLAMSNGRENNNYSPENFLTLFIFTSSPLVGSGFECSGLVLLKNP